MFKFSGEGQSGGQNNKVLETLRNKNSGKINL